MKNCRNIPEEAFFEGLAARHNRAQKENPTRWHETDG
jgi:hypothetical protein